MANKLNGKMRLVLWVAGVVFAAGGLAVTVYANSRAVARHDDRLCELERGMIKFEIMAEDVKIIKKAVLGRP